MSRNLFAPLALLLSSLSSAMAMDAPFGCQVRWITNVKHVSDPLNVLGDPNAIHGEIVVRHFSKADGQDTNKSPVNLDFGSSLIVEVAHNRMASSNGGTIAFTPGRRGAGKYGIGFLRETGWRGRSALLFSDGHEDHIADIYCW